MKFPLLPTLLVTASVVAMANLGFWQLDRKQQKEALIAQYRANAALPPIAWPAVPPVEGNLVYRRATGLCLEPTGWRAAAGRNAAGETGWIHIAACRTGVGRPAMQVNMGWSRSGAAPTGWRGGRVSGVIVPDRLHKIRLDSAVPAPGLEPAAPPAAPPPGNHLFYAIQWFFLAAAAAVIYGLVLRRRLKGAGLPATSPAPKSAAP